MHTGKRTVAMLAAVVVACAVVAAAAERAQQGAPANAQAAAGQGPALFAKVGCATCHGEGGRGTAAAPALAGTARPLADFVAYVRRPAGTMPPHGPQLVSDEALRDIHAFLRTSAAPAAAASSAAPAGRVDRGGALYKEYGCYQCHSNEAQGGMQGPRLGPNPVPYARFSSYVRRPTNDMPPYTARVVSDQDLADIYAWVAARPSPPPVSRIPLLAP